MPAGMEPATTVFMSSSEGERGQGGRADVVDLDREVVDVDDNTPPRTDVVERVGVEGGGGDAVLEEAPWTAPEGAPRAPTGGAPQATPTAAPERTPESAPVVEEAISGEYALVPRAGRGRVVGSQPARAGPSEVFFGPLTQEEAAMAAVSRRLRGRTDRIQAFAQAEVEQTRELERAVFQLDSYRVGVFNRLLEKHRQLKEQLSAKEEALRDATAEVSSWRTRLIRAGYQYDRVVADVGRVRAEVAEAKVEAAGARRALDEAGRLQEQPAGDKSRLEAEVDCLKAEASKVEEAQRVLAEACQQRDKLADDKGQLQAEVERLKALGATMGEAHQAKLHRRQEYERVAEAKDAELKVADLEKTLQEHDRTIARERRGMLLEAQHVEESFSRTFPETHQLAEEAVRFQRGPQGVVGSGTDTQVAWTFAEIVTTAEARLRVLGEQMGRLSEAGAAMTTALWPGTFMPNSFTRLARWLEAGPERLHAWRVSAARAGAEMALRFVISWHPDLGWTS
nr:uncharacterized protein LOC109740438 [Aegilops tauschii subsp. strangulata]